MARPRQFDSDAALDAAQGVFHARGFEATSVQHLVDATGLSRSSLYATFGDKHGLFLAVLDRYAEIGKAATDAVCASCSPVQAIRNVLNQAVTETGDAPGCLLVNVAVERASRDPEMAARSAAARRALDARFEGLIRRAQSDLEVGHAADPQRLAHFLTGTLYGIRALQTSGAPQDVLEDVAERAMRVIQQAA